MQIAAAFPELTGAAVSIRVEGLRAAGQGRPAFQGRPGEGKYVARNRSAGTHRCGPDASVDSLGHVDVPLCRLVVLGRGRAGAGLEHLTACRAPADVARSSGMVSDW